MLDVRRYVLFICFAENLLNDTYIQALADC